MIQNG